MNVRSYWRFLVVLWQFGPLLVAYARDRKRFLLFGRSREVSAQQRRRRASKLLDSLLTLGPTFIKLGQLLSTRPDILPPEYLTEFAKLQDRVPPAEWDEARGVIEAELGPVDEEFAAFDTDPISGASLGQVYEAQIDGQQVAVKVRRPGVETLVETDLRVVRWSVPILQRFVDDARSFSLDTVADEFEKTIRQEMDYEREARMLTEIRSNFADDDTVRIPEVVESHSTGRVLTMEYVGGTKITDIEGLEALDIETEQLAERLQEAYLQMIVEDGVFHADPHPGNLAVADDGTLIFYDFGMSGYVDPFIQERITDFYTAVIRQDTDEILDTLVEMGTLSPRADRELMGDILELAITDLRGDEIDQYRIQRIVQQVEDTIYEFPLRLPSNLALILRVATVVEGVCVTLDPEFDFISVATDYLAAEGYVEEGVRQYVSDRGQEVREAAGASVRVPPKLESVLDRMERDNLQVSADIQDPESHFRRLARRLVLGMTFAAGIVSTTVLFVAATPVAAGVGGVLTLLLGVLLYRSFQSGLTLHAEPQFTRQRMREEEGVGLGDTAADEPPDNEAGRFGGEGGLPRPGDVVPVEEGDASGGTDSTETAEQDERRDGEQIDVQTAERGETSEQQASDDGDDSGDDDDGDDDEPPA